MARSQSLAYATLVCLAIAAAAHPVTAQSDATANEANVKAVFLFNFSKYVAWPGRTEADRSLEAVRICVTANDQFYARLKAAVHGEEVDGRPLIPVALEGLDDAKTCHILYVGDGQSADGKAWLGAVRGRQVLTVADGPLNDDTVITFVRDSSRIRFDINRASAGRRDLTISAKLLRLARQVRDR